MEQVGSWKTRPNRGAGRSEVGKGLWQRGEGGRKLVCQVKEGELEGQEGGKERCSRKVHGEEGPSM